MRKLLLLTCSLAFCLTGCAPTGDKPFRAREERNHPDPSLETNNSESEVYKTQILAAPSAASLTAAPAGASPTSGAPAKLPAKPVPAHKTPPSAAAATPSGF